MQVPGPTRKVSVTLGLGSGGAFTPKFPGDAFAAGPGTLL